MLSLGFSKRDFAALMGSHTIGFASLEATGAHGRWTQNPHTFDNSYYKEVLLGEKSKFMKTPNEWLLLEDSDLKTYCEQYAQDQTHFFSDFASAHVRMSEYGHSNLMGELDQPITHAHTGDVQNI